MKKLIAILLTAVMILSALPVAAAASYFDDVADGKWYTEGIEFCYLNGYMAGVSDTQFDRNGTLTRAMFVTILASLEGVPTELYQYRPCFTDVAVGKWYSGAVAWAYENELASGLGDGTFGYKNPVTREQIAVFMLAYAKYANEMYLDMPQMDTSARADLSGYTDTGRIHDWAKDGVEWAVACGLISGTTETTLDPRGNCTRAQAAVIIRTLMTEVDKRCEHNWTGATCTDCGYCENCGLFSEGFADHSYNDEGLCTVCQAVYDPETGCGHVWINADCENDGYCMICGAAGETATGHDFVVDEDGSILKTCTVCGYWTCAGEHTWMDPTCFEDGYCLVCYDPYESALGHNLDEDGVCINCGGSYDEEAGCFHEWVAPDCENDGFCMICGMPGETSGGHEFDDGDCVNCGATECVHVWQESTCVKPRYCSVCFTVDETSPATGHDFIGASTYICAICFIHHNPNFTAHQNVMNNIMTRGTTLADGSKAFTLNVSEAGADITAALFMRPGNNSSVFSSLVSIDETGNKVTIELELNDQATEYNIDIEAETNGEFAFSVSATIDPVAFSETGAVNIVDSYFEIEYDTESVEMSVALLTAVSLLVTESILMENTNVSIADYGFAVDMSEPVI